MEAKTRPYTKKVEPLSPADLDRPIYTTGQVGRLLLVAPRTVSKWFDSGLLRGYRIPGSLDRRVFRDDLITFLNENGLARLEDSLRLRVVLACLPGELASRCREIMTLAGKTVVVCDGPFSLGLELGSSPACALALGVDALGRSTSAGVLGVLGGLNRRPRACVAVGSDDDGPGAELLGQGFSDFLATPADPLELARLLLKTRPAAGTAPRLRPAAWGSNRRPEDEAC